MAAYRARWASGISFVWRGLSGKQFREITAQDHDCPMSAYLAACRAALVMTRLHSFEIPFEQVPAGVIQFVGQQLLDHSPFNTRRENLESLRQRLDAARKSVTGDFLCSARALVAATFHYTFEEMDEWDADTFYQRYAQAELISGKVLNPVDPSSKSKPGALGPQKIPKRELTPAQKAVLERMNEIHR